MKSRHSHKNVVLAKDGEKTTAKNWSKADPLYYHPDKLRKIQVTFFEPHIKDTNGIDALNEKLSSISYKN